MCKKFEGTLAVSCGVVLGSRKRRLQSGAGGLRNFRSWDGRKGTLELSYMLLGSRPFPAKLRGTRELRKEPEEGYP